jgi:hypothetical protein
LASPKPTTPNRLSFGRKNLRGPLEKSSSLHSMLPRLNQRATFKKDSWEQQQDADQADEARLKRKLLICRTCLAGESERGDATDSVRR